MPVQVIASLDEVAPEAWDGLTAPDDPFTEHAFLSALERTGCVGPGTGWAPCHLLHREEAGGELTGAMPLYLRDGSEGEFIFDFHWAEAALAAGVPYYPKLTSAVPFTPVQGRRLLTAPGAAGERAARALLAGALDQANDLGAHGLHILFCGHRDQRLAVEAGMMPRLSHQFHWHNRGYHDFEDYLGRFRSRQRKNTRKERRRAAALGYQLRTLRGDELSGQQWDALHRFYQDTTGRKWGDAYLNRAFFREAQSALAHRVIVTLAERGDEPVAGALFMQRGDALYGRYWGSLVREEFLHFEICFYMPMELCIRQGWKRYEAGAQGIQKLRRGMMPSPTYSAHWLRHPGLAGAVERHLEQERPAVEEEMEVLGRHGPFRRGGEERATNKSKGGSRRGAEAQRKATNKSKGGSRRGAEAQRKAEKLKS